MASDRGGDSVLELGLHERIEANRGMEVLAALDCSVPAEQVGRPEPPMRLVKDGGAGIKFLLVTTAVKSPIDMTEKQRRSVLGLGTE